MTISSKRRAIIALLFSLSVVAFASSEKWKQFSSSNHFSVTYPATWFRIGISADRLNILTSKGGAKGVIIKRGQAEIIVTELRGPVNATLSQLIDDDTRDEAAILSRKDIRNEAAGKGGCSDLTEVDSKQEAVPGEDVPIAVPYVINTDFYCEVSGHKFSTLLKNWQDDPLQEKYKDVALRVAKSLRVT